MILTRSLVTLNYVALNDWIKKLRGLGPRANCADRVTAACRRS
jgi:hypothetical protein